MAERTMSWCGEVGVSDKILFAEKTCRNGAKEPRSMSALPQSDRLLQCREVTRWANSDIAHRSKK